jgi:hypothetical protein
VREVGFEAVEANEGLNCFSSEIQADERVHIALLMREVHGKCYPTFYEIRAINKADSKRLGKEFVM